MKDRCAGFTLVEMIVVVAIVGVLGFIMTDLLTNTLRGQDKVQLLNHIKQNGQVTLDRLSNEIRQAEKIICVNDDFTGNTDTIVLFKEGKYTRYRFYPEGTDNGYISWDNLSPGDVVVQSRSFFCESAQNTADKNILTDTDSRSGISLKYADTTGSFSTKIFNKDPNPGYKETVTIKFRAKQGVGAGTTSESSVNDEGILFQTTVQIRGEK